MKEVNTGSRAEMRSHEILTTYCMPNVLSIEELLLNYPLVVWDTKKPRDTTEAIGWIRGESGTALNHLRNCEKQPENVREEAAIGVKNRKGGGGVQMGPPVFAMPLNQAGVSSFQSLGIPGTLQPQGTSYLPVGFPNELGIYSESRSSASSVRGDSQSNSPYPESFLLQSNLRSSSVQPVHAASRTSPMEWSADRQNTFNMRIGRLTASAGLPLCWIENPEFILFCQEFIHPAANVPGRKALTNRILPTIRRDFRKKAQAATREGAMATIQADGWSAINDHHLNAFMMTVDRKVCNSLYCTQPN